MRDQRRTRTVLGVEHKQRRYWRHVHHAREPLDCPSRPLCDLLRARRPAPAEHHRESYPSRLSRPLLSISFDICTIHLPCGSGGAVNRSHSPNGSELPSAGVGPYVRNCLNDRLRSANPKQNSLRSCIAVCAVQASHAGVCRRSTFDKSSPAIEQRMPAQGRRSYVVIRDKNSYLESCTITRCGCVGSTCRATVAPNTEEMEDLMTHLPERAHTEPAHLVACTTVDDLFIRCRAMDLKRW